ncbi:MAG: hypothetical protein F6K40_14975 [Okeania sp. SIO3I5]|uniref:hypothetical protein n=1 Tax=Okeania sp. SIO3I5 TaxID=2607805 RepID=UPI0013BBBC08|nr:hypothetical protein [Okeania sp. SIO3I5]NEQ37500.1 hypothetical protein [Okeania sp. SIO3I5]
MDFIEIKTAYLNILGDCFNKQMSSLEYLLKRIILIYRIEKFKNLILIDRAIELIESMKFPSWDREKITPVQKNILENFIKTTAFFLNQSKEYLVLSKINYAIEEKDDFRLIIAAERAILNCRMLVVKF